MSPHYEISPTSAALAHADRPNASPGIPESSGWMDTDIQRWHHSPGSLVHPSRSKQLCRLRQQFHREAAERHNRHAKDRQLCLVAYNLVLGVGARPDEDWNTLRAEAEQHGYAMGPRLHDVAVPVATSDLPGSRASHGVYTPPWKRPGWGEVERLIRGGFADGVIVLDRYNISSNDDEYHAVIKHLGERYQAFVHLVIPEVPAAPT